MLILRILIAVAVLITLISGGALLAVRLADGPLGPIAGGKFDSGQLHAGDEPDRAHLADRRTVEFQLLEAEADGRALLRVDGTLYRRQLRRVQDGPLLEPVIDELNRKYAVGASVAAVTSGSLWLFELAPATRSTALLGRPRG